MAVPKLECPECGTVLRPAKPISPGKKVRCPKCQTTFVAPDDEEDRPAPRKTATARTAPTKKAAPARSPTAPPPKKTKPVDDEEDEGGVYGLAKEAEEDEEDEERKPKIEYVPDLQVKDPRGPAVAALAKPSNYLLLFGALLCVGSLLSLGIATWPFMFTKYGSGVFPSDVKRKWAKDHAPPDQQPRGRKNQEEEESAWPDQDQIMEEIKKNEGMFALWEEMSSKDQTKRIIWAICSVLAGALAAVLAASAVKMQNLESYRWAVTACIMGAVCGIVTAATAAVAGSEASGGDDVVSYALWFCTFFTGSDTAALIAFSIWGFVLLRKPEIIEAFEYNPE
jgi:predicted Zn finger-like uncharacterized protein